jgi:hypothetical protein
MNVWEVLHGNTHVIAISQGKIKEYHIRQLKNPAHTFNMQVL